MFCRLAFVTVTLLYLGAGPLHAGLYNRAEPEEAPAGPVWTSAGIDPMPFDRFRRDVLSELRGLANLNPPSARRRQYVRRCEDLQARARSARLGVQEQADLGAYLMRLRQYDDAIRILSVPAAEERPSGAVLANLGTAYQQAGQLDRAAFFLQRLRRRGRWEGLTPAQLAWYRRAEEYHLKLVLLRSSEPPPAPGQRPPEHVDNLFGPADAPVRFVGESGHYEAGRIAPAERAKLPPDAVAIVEQLLVWLPDDTRLYWLLGELFNAQGDVAAAVAILEECVWARGWTAEELKEHRRLLKEAKLPATAEEISLPPAPQRTLPPQPDWLPSRGRIIAVGVIVAAVAVILVIFQIREVRRRRAARARG